MTFAAFWMDYESQSLGQLILFRRALLFNR